MSAVLSLVSFSLYFYDICICFCIFHADFSVVSLDVSVLSSVTFNSITYQFIGVLPKTYIQMQMVGLPKGALGLEQRGCLSPYIGVKIFSCWITKLPWFKIGVFENFARDATCGFEAIQPMLNFLDQ